MSLLKFVVVHSTSSSSYDQLWGGAAAPAHRGAAAAPAHPLTCYEHEMLLKQL